MTAGSTPPPPTPARPEGTGIECPQCGCQDLRVMWIRHRPGYIVRRRRCRHCGKEITTREKVAGTPEVG